MLIPFDSTSAHRLFALSQVIYSRTCDRKSNPLRTIAIMAPSADSKDVPYTIMVASNVIELHQKARVRQKDTIISSFYNERFKHFVVVGARRIYMWNAYTGILAKTYNSELPHPPGMRTIRAVARLSRYQSMNGKLKVVVCFCFGGSPIASARQDGAERDHCLLFG